MTCLKPIVPARQPCVYMYLNNTVDVDMLTVEQLFDCSYVTAGNSLTPPVSCCGADVTAVVTLITAAGFDVFLRGCVT